MLAKGHLAEDRAILFLQQKGFIIVDRNFYTKYGEIDIIAKKDSYFDDGSFTTTLHFVEVKSAAIDKDFDPVQNLNEQKIQRLIKSIAVYNNQFKLDLPYVLDAVIIRGDFIEHLENITA